MSKLKYFCFDAWKVRLALVGVILLLTVVGILAAAEGIHSTVCPWCGNEVQLGSLEKVEPPPDLLEQRKMGFCYWNIKDPYTLKYPVSSSYYTELAEIWGGVKVTVQNGWPHSMKNPSKAIPSWAEQMAKVGWSFQPYFTNYQDPASVAALEVWPDNVERAMAASEGPWSQEHMALLRAATPDHILTAYPEGSSIHGIGRYASQNYAQIWGRGSPWYGEATPGWAFRSPIGIAGGVVTAQAAGAILVAAGPQMYSTYYGAPEEKRTIWIAVNMIAQVSLRRGIDILSWGDNKLSIEDGLNQARVFAGVIKSINALPLMADAEPVAPVLGVFLDSDHSLNFFGQVKLWETLFRLGIPFEVFDSIAEAGKYEVLLIPALFENEWNQAEKDTYIARKLTANVKDQAKIDALDPVADVRRITELRASIAGRLATIQRQKDSDWPVKASFTDAEEIFLQELGIPILTECGDAARYGGHGAAYPPSRIPRWENVFPIWLGGAWGNKQTWTRMPIDERFIAFQTQVISEILTILGPFGITSLSDNPQISRKAFMMRGVLWYWDVNLVTGEPRVYEVVDPG